MPPCCRSSSDFPIQFSFAFYMHLLLCCSLPCSSQILKIPIFSFSVLSFSRTDQEYICSDPGFLLLTGFAKDLTGFEILVLLSKSCKINEPKPTPTHLPKCLHGQVVFIHSEHLADINMHNTTLLS